MEFIFICYLSINCFFDLCQFENKFNLQVIEYCFDILFYILINMFGFGQNLVIFGIFIKCISVVDFMVSLLYLLSVYFLKLGWIFRFFENLILFKIIFI